jgi:hypothetical protein
MFLHSMFVLTALVSSVAVGGAQIITQPASVTRPTVSIGLRAPQSTIKSGAPLNLEITLKNISDQVIHVDEDVSSKGELTYTVIVHDRDQNEAPSTRYNRTLRGKVAPGDPISIIQTSSIAVTLQPGKNLVDKLDVADLYDLSRPGLYSVWVERVDPVTHQMVMSNKISVTVEPAS